ncbi:hypothetical protein MRX96_045273 [Rhipicephalus microplus]
MLYIAHCEVKIQHCEVKNGSCVYGGNKTVKDGYDILSKPPNCTQWVCNVSAEAFVITGCPPPSNHPYLALPMNAGDCFWPKCCNKSAHATREAWYASREELETDEVSVSAECARKGAP